MTSAMLRRLMIVFLLACAAGVAGQAHGADSAASAADPSREAPAGVPAATDASRDDVDEGDSSRSGDRFDRHARARWRSHRDWSDHQNGDIVSIGHDSTLAGGEHAQSVVSIFGSSTSAG